MKYTHNNLIAFLAHVRKRTTELMTENGFTNIPAVQETAFPYPANVTLYPRRGTEGYVCFYYKPGDGAFVLETYSEESLAHVVIPETDVQDETAARLLVYSFLLCSKRQKL